MCRYKKTINCDFCNNVSSFPFQILRPKYVGLFLEYWIEFSLMNDSHEISVASQLEKYSQKGTRLETLES